MKINLYFTDSRSSIDLDDNLSGVSTLDTKYNGQYRVQRIVDVKVDHTGEGITILVEAIPAPIIAGNDEVAYAAPMSTESVEVIF